jgi:hypothetical protein
MCRRVVGAWCILLILSSGLLALEVVGTVKKVDADKGIIIFHANGQDRTLKADKNLKVLDVKGKDLAEAMAWCGTAKTWRTTAPTRRRADNRRLPTCC